MEPNQAEGILVTRRRLSVVSDSRLIEGLGQLGDTNVESLDAFSEARAEGGRGRATVDMETAPGVGGGVSDLACRGIGGCGQMEGAGTRHDQHEDEEDQDETIACVVSSYAGFSKKGYAPYNPRKCNQDALIMAEDTSTASLLLVVMDGHGEAGEQVAQKFRRHLAPSVFGHPDWQSSPETAVADSIAEIERALLGDASVDTDYSGTTLVSVCVRGSQLVLTNVGDSRATLGRRRTPGEGDKGRGEEWGESPLVAHPLTEDHKPDNPSEKQRILDAGGRVFSVDYADGVDGPPRVWLGNVDMPGLAMSRSLGDAIAHTAGVISDPDTFRCDLTAGENDYKQGHLFSAARHCGEGAAVLILATDGLWEFLSDQEAVDIASQCPEPRQAVEKLTKEAAGRWMKEEQVIDDITVCVAFLNGWAGGMAG